MKDVIERLRKLEADTSDCFPEVMTLVAGVRSNLPKLLNRLEKLEAVVEAAREVVRDPYPDEIEHLAGTLKAIEEEP